VLMKSDLGDVLTALDLSTKTFRRIRLNYLWAFGYNCLMIPLAAGALFPPTRWQMPPWVAGAHCLPLLLVHVRCALVKAAGRSLQS
jgi:P-type Cu+ transporter